MKDLAVAVSNSLSSVISPLKAIESIKKAGFENVCIQWFNNEYWEYSQEVQLNYIRKMGLNVIFAYLGYKSINSIWEKDHNIPIVDLYKQDIRACRDNNISMVVMRLTNGLRIPDYTELGVARIQEIADCAQKLNMRIAFESTERKDCLDFVFANIKNDNVGICFDSGRHHIHSDNDFAWDLYNNRIFSVLLHDNNRWEDLHLLPFDGTIDWQKLIKILRDSNYEGPIVLDPRYRSNYLKISPLKFYKKSYRVGKELVGMFEKESS